MYWDSDYQPKAFILDFLVYVSELLASFFSGDGNG